MSLDTTHDMPGSDVDIRPASAISPLSPGHVVLHDATAAILSGTVHPGHSPFHHGTHPAYAQLPPHITALNDYRNLPRPHPEIIEIIRHYHLWPILGSCAFSATGWWAHMEPNHIWLMLPFLGFGIAGPVASWVAHHFHGDAADRHITHGFLAGGLIGMSGAAAVGAGFSGISAMTTALLAIVGTLGSMGWRSQRRQAAADAAIDYMESAAKAPMPPAPVGGTPVPIPGVVGGGILSDEAARLHAAFTAIGVSPIQVDAIRRTGADAWLTYIYTPESKTINYRWLATRVDTLRGNMACRSFEIIPTAIGNRFEIRVQDGADSPIEDVEHWPGPNTDDVTQPVNIGPGEAGTPIAFRLKGRHTMYAGITDGGKSIGVNVMACAVASMKNAVLVLMDLKPGQLELGPYEPVAYRAAYGIDDAELLLKALGAAMEVRGQILKEERERTGKPVKEWDPNIHGPAIVVLIDELAEMLRLDPKLFELWIRLMQVARALGIYIIAATQSPSSKAMGGTTDGTGQFTNVACYRTKNATQTNVILGPGSHGEGWTCDETTLPLPGMFRPRTPEYPRPSRGRGYMITPERIVATVTTNADSRPALDERTHDAMEKILVGRCDPRSPDPRGGRPADTDPIVAANAFHAGEPFRLHVVSAPRYPDNTVVEEKHREAWDLFRSLGSATALELQAHNLPGMGSQQPCMAALKAFKLHGGATSAKDTDSRSERFTCTVPAARRKDA